MTDHDLAALYRDAAFARRLAARIVGEGAAEDVWHAAWVALLERPPRSGSNLPGYLRTVVRRIALRYRRRAQTEGLVARARGGETATPSTSAIVEGMEAHRQVVEALLELDEPFQRTLFLLYFQDRSPAEVARAEGVPLETVRSRAKRGIVLMRERLERARGGDRGWLRGLALLAGLEDIGRGPRETRLVPWPAAWVAGLGALAASIWILWPEHPRLRGGPQELLGLAGTEEPRSAVPARLARREPRPSGPAPEAPPATFLVPGRRIHGRVSYPTGAPIPGVRVALGLFGSGSNDTEPLLSGETDEAGAYDFDVPALAPHAVRGRQFLIEAYAPGHSSASDTALPDGQGADVEIDFVLEPGFLVEGRVLDERGEPASGAALLVQTSSDGGETWDSDGSDRRGSYHFGFPARCELLTVHSWDQRVGSGFLTRANIPSVVGGILRLPDIVLRERGVLRGRAVYPDGTPARGTTVLVRCVERDGEGRYVVAPKVPLERGGLSRALAPTDEDGRFVALGLRPGPWSFELASRARSSPGTVVPEVQVAEEGEEATLVVDEHRVVVAVVDGSGGPVADVRVALTELEATAGGGWRPRSEAVRRVSLEHGVAFPADPGDVVAATVVVPGGAEERIFLVPAEPYEVYQRIELPAATLHGTLGLRGVDPADGRELREFEVRLALPDTRLSVGTWRTDARGFARDLPCGSFHVELVPLVQGIPAGCFAPTELDGPVVVEPGERELSFPLERGAKLTCAFQTEEGREPEPFRHPESKDDWPMWVAVVPEAVLRRPQDGPGSPPFLVLEGAEPGMRWTSRHALPAGRYRLEARFDGFEPVEEWIDIGACQTSEVRVVLAPEVEGAR